MLKLAPEDEDKDAKIERRSQRNRGQECSGNIVKVEVGGCARVTRACSGQGSGSQGGLIDLPTCHPTEVKFRCGLWKWPKTQKKIEWNAHNNFVASLSWDCRQMLGSWLSNLSFCNCYCPDWFCQCQTSVEDIDIKPQRIHGLNGHATCRVLVILHLQ